MKTEYFYIYNFKQAQYFIDNQLPIVEIGKGSRGDIYHKFKRDNQSEEVFMNWKKLKYGSKAV